MSARIPAYIFNAEIICANCAWEAFRKEANYTEPYYYFTGAEPVLDALAKLRGIDRYDERSYDSSVFPKVVFDHDLDRTHEDAGCDGCEDGHGGTCGRCREKIEA